MKGLVCVFLLLISFSTFASAGSNPVAKVGVHVLPHSDRSCSKDFPAMTTCHDIIHTYGGTGNIDAFPVFLDLVEYQGFEYGLTWPAEWGSCSFTSCSCSTRIFDETYGDPDTFNPGDWVGQVWNVFQSGPVAVPGWAWLDASSSGRVCIIEPGPPYSYDAPVVGDCTGGQDFVVCSFCAGVGGEAGDEPCFGSSSTAGSAWSSIKAMFR